jgi:signal transduction histidine kinase
MQRCRVTPPDVLASVAVGIALLVGSVASQGEEPPAGNLPFYPWELHSVEVNGKVISPDDGGAFVLPSRISNLQFQFASNPLASNAPVRVKWQLDGFQKGWHDTRAGMMRMVVRFANDDGEVLQEISFPVSEQTPAWTGRFSDCTYVRRLETLIPPPGATSFWVMISSAGPPTSVGVYAVRKLVYSQPGFSTNGTAIIPRVARDALDKSPGRNPAPPGWIRDGLQRNNAWVIPYGNEGEIALAIVDDSVDGHAAWATPRVAALPAVAGEPLILEWEEAYSISLGGLMTVSYKELPAGLYRFRIGGFTVMGEPTGVEVSVPVNVPVSMWKTTWFWSMLTVAGVAFGLAAWRFSEWRGLERRMKAMERDRAIEQERIRIAQDIHDDLGARVTEISLLSSAAQRQQGLPADAQRDFEQVSRLSRNMVTALYETVWAVSPENDHLDELGAYVCQVANQMCAQAGMKCRLSVPDLPHDVPLGSKHRHDLIMTVKEAIHNVVRHSGASELHIQITYENRVLDLTVSDNGSGFDVARQAGGNGLANMKRRMESCQGSCTVVSRPGEGTQVRLELPLPIATASETDNPLKMFRP